MDLGRAGIRDDSGGSVCCEIEIGSLGCLGDWGKDCIRQKVKGKRLRTEGRGQTMDLRRGGICDLGSLGGLC